LFETKYEYTMKKIFAFMCAFVAGVVMSQSVAQDVETMFSVQTSGVNGKVTGVGSYVEGSVVTIEAIPYANFYFVNWQDGVTDNPRSFIITQDTSFVANFDTDVTYTLTVQSNNEEYGYVTGGGTYKLNSSVPIRAYANVGYKFVKWNDGSTYASRSITVKKDQTYTAEFEPFLAGENLKWSFDDVSGTLTISGTGDMYNWTSEKNVPWYSTTLKSFLPIKHVVIEEGVTSVGDYAFRNCSTILSISLPTSLISIGQYAFRSAGISSVVIPANVATIGPDAFYNCTNLNKVTSLALVPPSTNNSNIFNTSSMTFYIPCGTATDYKSASGWHRYTSWQYNEGAYDYSLDVYTVVLQEPTCSNKGSLTIQAVERDGYFFSQWNDGNSNNPRTIQLNEGQHYEFVPEYIEGEQMIVCKGYEFVNPEDKQTYIIDKEQVIGKYHFFFKTANKPALSSDKYPVMQIGRLYYGNAAKALRKQYAEQNPNGAEIKSIEWSYSISNDKTSDTYVKSDLLPSDDYEFAWVKYTVVTECGDTWSDTIQVSRTAASGATPTSLSSMEKREFWVALTLSAAPSSGTPTPFIAVSTQKPTIITITNPNDPTWPGITRNAAANSWEVFESEIPLEKWYPTSATSINNIKPEAGKIHNFGLKVETDEDVSVYAALWMENSFDAANILPEPVLQSEYYVQDYPPYIKPTDGDALSMFTILAAENNTQVIITPSTETQEGHPAGESYVVSLNAGQTYYVISRTLQSLSGTHVQSNGKKIAVFQGDVFTQIPGGKAARDCLYEQAMPVDYWGTKFVVTRSKEKDANRVRVTALEDETSLYIDGHQMATINAGETYEFEMSIGDLSSVYSRLVNPLPDVIHQDAVYLEASCPVAVYSYDVSNGYAAGPTEMDNRRGDPSMVWISSLEQRIDDITFGVCGTQKTDKHYINIVCPTAATAYTKITPMPYEILTWTPVFGNPDWSYARIHLATVGGSGAGNRVFRLENPQGCIAHVYGNGNDESYAYSVGSIGSKAYLRGLTLNGGVYMSGMTIESQYCLGDPITFEALVGNEEIDWADWEFGDGKKIRNGDLQVEHLYAKEGSYEVKAKVYTHRECPFTLYEPEELTLKFHVGVPDTIRREYPICDGESFIYNGRVYAKAAKDTIAYDCDSVEILSVVAANCQVEAPDTVAVEPTDHTAAFIWPIMPEAISYTLTIWADQAQTVMLCTLTFNAAGYLTNINFGSGIYASPSPMRSQQKKQREESVTMGTTTLNFTVTGLEDNHTYYFLLQAYDESDNQIDEKTGSFTTENDVASGISNLSNEVSTPIKLLRDGQIVILRGDKTYTLTGQETK
jgi:hypothetical protein